jgi:hypothetical protein
VDATAYGVALLIRAVSQLGWWRFGRMPIYRPGMGEYHVHNMCVVHARQVLMVPRTRTRRQRIIQHNSHAVVMLLALALVGGTTLLLWSPLASHPTQPPTHVASYSSVPTLLAQARAHGALLALPHAHWFVRVHHGHVEIVVQDHAAGLGATDSVAVAGGQ